jgi:N-acetylglucosaminyldiphosphoundecaprenol N-acetyl-beta-D-mannosaminyltransferase
MSSVEFASAPVRRQRTDLHINIANAREALAAIAERTVKRRGYTFFTANLDHVVKLGQDRRFGEAYHRADFVTADGWPIVWSLKQSGADLQRTTGADLLEPVCRQAAAQGASVYFVGPSAQSQAEALAELERRIPDLRIAGREAPRFAQRLADAEADALAERIRSSDAGLCVVSLGAPKQELLADMLHARCPEVGFLCFGAALDFISGHVARAPLWLQRAGLEWAWRLVSAPGRLGARYAACALVFAGLSLPTLFPRLPRLKLSRRAAEA